RVRGLAAAQRDLLIREQGGFFRDLALDAERLAVSLESAERRAAFLDEKQAEGGFTIYGDAATDAVALEGIITRLNERIGEQQTELDGVLETLALVVDFSQDAESIQRQLRENLGTGFLGRQARVDIETARLLKAAFDDLAAADVAPDPTPLAELRAQLGRGVFTSIGAVNDVLADLRARLVAATDDEARSGLRSLIGDFETLGTTLRDGVGDDGLTDQERAAQAREAQQRAREAQQTRERQARDALDAQEQAAEARAQLLAEERRAEIEATQDGLQRRVALIDLEYDERLRRERIRVAEQIQQQQALIEEATTEQVRTQARANLAAFRAQEAQIDALYGEGGAARQLEIAAVLDLDIDLDAL
ncbi:MAG: hypothetical protein AAFP86_22160, partial [Planctomycetota bacterium]